MNMASAIPKRVFLESPYAGGVESSRFLRFVYRLFPSVGVKVNVWYGQMCMRDSLLRGEAPFAGHLLYTLPMVLRDKEPAERKMGMEAAFAWGLEATATVVYTDRGISPGMKVGIMRALDAGRPVFYRRLGKPDFVVEMRSPGIQYDSHED